MKNWRKEERKKNERKYPNFIPLLYPYNLIITNAFFLTQLLCTLLHSLAISFGFFIFHFVARSFRYCHHRFVLRYWRHHTFHCAIFSHLSTRNNDSLLPLFPFSLPIPPSLSNETRRLDTADTKDTKKQRRWCKAPSKGIVMILRKCDSLCRVRECASVCTNLRDGVLKAPDLVGDLRRFSRVP